MKLSDKTVFTARSVGECIGVYTNLKELYTALSAFNEANDYPWENFPTYAELCRLRREADNNNRFFYYELEDSDYNDPLANTTIREVYLNGALS